MVYVSPRRIVFISGNLREKTILTFQIFYPFKLSFCTNKICSLASFIYSSLFIKVYKQKQMFSFQQSELERRSTTIASKCNYEVIVMTLRIK